MINVEQVPLIRVCLRTCNQEIYFYENFDQLLYNYYLINCIHLATLPAFVAEPILLTISYLPFGIQE